MLIDNLEILDMDLRILPNFKNIHKDGLVVCKKVGAILDLATSDVCLYLYAKSKRDAQKVANVYGTTAQSQGKPRLGSKVPKNMRWYCIES